MVASDNAIRMGGAERVARWKSANKKTHILRQIYKYKMKVSLVAQVSLAAQVFRKTYTIRWLHERMEASFKGPVSVEVTEENLCVRTYDHYSLNYLDC